MQLIDAIKQSGRPFEIPNCDRTDLPGFFVQMGFEKGAEIGVMHGKFSVLFAKAGLEHYAIDPWLVYGDYPSGSQEKADAEYQSARSLLQPFSKCRIIRKTSMEAVQDFEDNSLDYVYIDGNHQLRYVVEDICEWSKKVRPGGVVSGHDYFYCAGTRLMNMIHVPQAVKAYVGCYGIESFYILGSKVAAKGERRDRWRSWMWIKP